MALPLPNDLRRNYRLMLFRSNWHSLVRGEGFAADASIVKADAQRQRGVPGEHAANSFKQDEASRAVREYLAGLQEANAAVTTPKNVSLTDPTATWTG